MVFVVIVFVLLHFTVKQVAAEEVQCPGVCQCQNETVALCRDRKISSINIAREGRLGSVVKALDFSGNKLCSLSDKMFSVCDVLLLQYLNLSSNHITYIGKFSFTGLTELEDLDLSRNNISSIDGEAFYANLKLSIVRLANNRLTEINETVFSPLIRLKYLDLSNNKISSIQKEMFHSNTDLEWLSLTNNSLTAIDPSTFQQQSNLTYLDLSGNKITQIKRGMFYNNMELESLLLGDNKISELHPSAFHADCGLSYLDVSGNLIEKLENLTFYRLKFLSISRNKLQRLHSRSFCNCSELRNLSLSDNDISEINDEAFYGLWQLEYLDLSSNNIKNISLSIFQGMVLQMEGNMTKSDSMSNLTYLKLSKNKIHYFPFKEYLSLTDSCHTSTKLCKLDLNGNCLSVLDDESVNVLGNSTVLTELSDNPWSCNCSEDSSERVYRMLSGNRTLKCATPEYSKGKSCSGVKHTCLSTTSTPGTDSSVETEADENLEENEDENPKLLTNPESETFPTKILLFVIYVISMLVAIVIVLVISRAVGKPEPDEYWWEDKLAKRNYY
ncbi:hypothetical protein B7P43_G03339 [Cryptotermes secundus]|uniref:LRRCT domain-containing protein n=1 Tax=Cryptotermes secundus TaxID=105785 RepID=A0A2J7PR07_9NEOP|nr:leucine-rich repeat-containing protein 70 [Cryptotermes secundus]PNF18764.1 hypothetical protein B7P43_G03339 [Cryptotermes secundus]